MKRNSAKLRVNGSVRTWLGVNFLSRTGGPLMWRSYDPQVVARELRVMRDNGIAVTRSFFYWPDFMPSPHTLDETMVERYRDFLDRHVDQGMTTVPTFIVGHMSGQNWDPAWRQGRDLFRDVWLVARQCWFARELVRRFHDHPAVAGWLVSNEMPIYGDPQGSGTLDADQVISWAELMVDAVRAGGATQPVSLGDGAWGVEVTGRDNGFRVRDIAGLVDFLGPHVYRMEDDQVRQHLGAAFICELLGFCGKPVVLEEFGVTTDFVSEQGAADYYRQVLHNSLLAGATGWLAWNNTDYDDLAGQDPYRHHPFEMHFGLTDGQGRPKRHLREVAAFRGTLDRIDVDRCHRPDASAVLLVSSYLEARYPFTEPEDAAHVFDTARQAYVAAREADLPLGVAREADGIPDGCRLYLVPSTKQLTAPGWHRLEELARGGAIVYVSYCAGTHGVQRGPWYAHMDALFGVEHRLRYGLVDPIEDDEVRLTFRRGFGDIPEGDRLSFRVAGTAGSRAYLPVRAAGAEVLAEDAHGRPALLRRRVGEGSVVLGTYPLEHLAAATPRVNPEPTYRLYSALAEEAGVDRDVRVGDPRIMVSEMAHEDGRRFVWFVSQDPERREFHPSLTSGLTLLDEEGEPLAAVDVGPFGVRVLELVATESLP